MAKVTGTPTLISLRKVLDPNPLPANLSLSVDVNVKASNVDPGVTQLPISCDIPADIDLTVTNSPTNYTLNGNIVTITVVINFTRKQGSHVDFPLTIKGVLNTTQSTTVNVRQ